ncbi:hypothetical protein ACFFQW_21905 [Umezawaea endophytica]|uniref:Uncharacterized protein n=1 Tax=Umezawaea endophytica TaxID=1654476 RepID=A0A9X2VIY2_9PSEU|nr:hypothetical protein [Umezawaea endophytica]MCS7477401.1 hypothetical protein [Umezawaea endophytica]
MPARTKSSSKDTNDLPVMHPYVVTKGGTDDQCPTTESLASLALLSRLPLA